jgi:hypothetical protein
VQGNHNGRGKEKGNGRIVVTKLNVSDTGCVWETQKVVHIPKLAYFGDYSDIDIQKTTGRVIVTSQEEAAIWLGRLNLTTFEIEDEGVVLHFPRSSDGCKAIYCNIEGVQWIDECVPVGLLFALFFASTMLI